VGESGITKNAKTNPLGAARTGKNEKNKAK
jgi:hypothetical protein